MTRPSDGGSSVNILIDTIRDIANLTMAKMENDAHSETSTFRSLKLHDGTFSEVPSAQAVARQHAAAHTVFVETVDGVLSDLRDFQRKLKESADSHDATDQQAQANMAHLGRDYGEHHFHSDRDYDRGREHQGSRLHGAPPVSGGSSSGNGSQGQGF